jgi:3'-5' exoribonuclease
MTRKKPTIERLSDLRPGHQADFYAQLAERIRGQTRDGKPYFTCRFRDSRRTATAMIWQDSEWFEPCLNEWREGQCFKLRATYGEHDRYGPQLDIEQIRLVRPDDEEQGFDPWEFLPRSRFDAEAMYQQLLDLIAHELAYEPLRRLVVGVLEGNKARLLKLPATAKHYHPFAGGWLEHTLAVVRHCGFLADRYRQHYPELTPPLNRDLLLAAAALHEIGRVAEWDDDWPPQPTTDGRLLGHLFLGRDIIRDAARQIPELDAEWLRLLEHLLVTHLNLPEWGSPRLPAIPECLILHHADDLDAKMEMYVRCLTRDVAEGEWTERDPVLNRSLWKGRRV